MRVEIETSPAYWVVAVVWVEAAPRWFCRLSWCMRRFRTQIQGVVFSRRGALKPSEIMLHSDMKWGSWAARGRGDADAVKTPMRCHASLKCEIACALFTHEHEQTPTSFWIADMSASVNDRILVSSKISCRVRLSSGDNLANMALQGFPATSIPSLEQVQLPRDWCMYSTSLQISAPPRVSSSSQL